NVTRTLQQVVVRVVLAELSFYPRVGDQQTEQDRHTDRTGEEHRRNRVRPEIQLPGGPDTQDAVRPRQVPVGLRTRRHLRGQVRADVPHRVDLEQAGQQDDHAGDDQEERAEIGRAHV